jgi:hypothetical protein
VPVDIGGVAMGLYLALRVIVWKDGQIRTLICAQEDNILTQASLREIALMTLSSNFCTDTDTELRCGIIQDYFNQVIKPISVYASLEDFEIRKEYGVFDEHIVVGFNRYFVSPGMQAVEIGGVVICLELASFMIVVWKGGQVHTLISAQENNILSQASLREIALMDHTPLFQL